MTPEELGEVLKDAEKQVRRCLSGRSVSDFARVGLVRDTLTRRENRERKGPSRFADHFEVQRACLRALSAARSSVRFADDEACLLVSGSIARLEYLPGCSDVDLLAVARAKPFRIRVRRAKSEAKDFSNFRRRVKHRLCHCFAQEYDDVNAVASSDIEIDGVPFGGQRLYYTDRDLYRLIGREREPSWAVYERAHFLFEGVELSKDGARFSELRRNIAAKYGIVEDLKHTVFPLVGHCLCSSLMLSGVLAKCAHVRAQKWPDCAPLVAKLLTGRVWASGVNALGLHLMYWWFRLGKFRLFTAPPTEEEVLRWLREPPIAKLAVRFPRLIGEVMLARGAARAKKELSETTYTRLKEVASELGWGRGSKPNPLWSKYLRMLTIRRDVEEKRLPLAYWVEEVFELNRSLCEALSLAERVSAEWLCTKVTENTIPYAALNGLLGALVVCTRTADYEVNTGADQAGVSGAGEAVRGSS